MQTSSRLKIIRAEHLGMCFGVRDAIALAHRQACLAPLTVLGDLVHNETVLRDMRARGIRIAQNPSEASTTEVMVTAHGASEKAKVQARLLGLHVTEATCPLVTLAHRALARLVAEGYYPVIIGKQEHVEVRGMTEDLEEFDVILGETDVARLVGHPKIGLVAQTTQPIDRVRNLVAIVRRRFPTSDVRLVDTVCRPTKQRQHAAVELAQQVEVVVVIGGAHSNNTRELVNTCRRYCSRVYQVQTASDMCSDWFDGVRTVGVTAGTSTPDSTIDEVERWLTCLSVPASPRCVLGEVVV